MERLTEKKRNYDGTAVSKKSLVRENGKLVGTPSPHCIAILNKLADYEDKKEQGLLIELPVAEGTPVYEVDRNCKHEGHCYFDTMCNGCKYEEAEYGIHETKFTAFDLNRVGKTVFLTHEQAEEALAKMGGK